MTLHYEFIYLHLLLAGFWPHLHLFLISFLILFFPAVDSLTNSVLYLYLHIILGRSCFQYSSVRISVPLLGVSADSMDFHVWVILGFYPGDEELQDFGQMVQDLLSILTGFDLMVTIDHHQHGHTWTNKYQ